MPVIRQYTRQLVPNGLSRASVSSASLGVDGISSGLRGLSQSVGAFGDVLKERQHKADQSDYFSKLAPLLEENARRKQELTSLEFSADADLGATYKQDFDERADALDIPDSMQERWQNDRVKMGLDFFEFGLEDQSRRSGIRTKINWENTLDSLTNMVSLDPSKKDDAFNVLQNMSESFPNMSPEEKSVLLDSGKDTINNSTIMSLSESIPRDFINQAKAGRYNDADPRVLASAINNAKGEINSREVRAKKIQTEVDQSILNDIKLRIFESRDINSEPSIKQSDLDNHLKQGLLKPQSYIKASLSLENSTKDRHEKYLKTQRMTAINNGEINFNPNDKDDVEAADEYYESTYLPQLEGLNPNEQILAKTSFAVERGVIPKALERELQGNIYSGTPEQKVESSNIINDVISRNNSLARQFNNSDIAFSSKVSSGVQAGLSAAEAVDFAEAQTFLKDTPEFSARNSVFNKEGSKFKNKKVQQLFRNDPNEIPPEMIDEWRSLYRFYGVNEGVQDEDAQNAAYNKLQSTWGVSNVTGKPEWLKYSPESYYKVEGQDNSWMFNQLRDITGEINDVDVVPDLRTVESGRPSYQIIKKTISDDGNIFIDTQRNEAGEAVFWQPSYKDSPEYKKSVIEFNKKEKSQRDKFEKERINNREIIELFGKVIPERGLIRGPRGVARVSSQREGF